MIAGLEHVVGEQHVAGHHGAADHAAHQAAADGVVVAGGDVAFGQLVLIDLADRGVFVLQQNTGLERLGGDDDLDLVD
jgi:hypothetical protein